MWRGGHPCGGLCALFAEFLYLLTTSGQLKIIIGQHFIDYKTVRSISILCTFSMALALGKMRAHDRAVQPPAQPRLVACLGLIACLQLLLQLPHQHVHAAPLLSSSLSYMCVTLCAAQAVRYVLTRMVKVLGVLEFYFLEW